MQITKALSKDFFNLIRDEKKDRFDQLMQMLGQYPELANSVVSGMAKGIDGFSALMLAVRYYNFRFAIELVKAGADVNYMDHSPARQNYNPVLFDLLEMLKNLIEVGKTEDVKEGILLWESMESNGLDYSKKSIENDGVNESENCLEAFIRIASTQYEHQHKIHYDSDQGSYQRSDKSRKPENEKWYELITKKIVNALDESMIKNIDANRHRDSGNVFKIAADQYEIIDYFSLESANENIKQKFGYEITNMNDLSFMDDYKDFAPSLES